MKHFQEHTLDLGACRKEVMELKALLDGSGDLKEARDILPFFRARPNLSALTGLYNPNIARFDRVAWQYELFGDFGDRVQ